jgi:hypothetical protein
LAEVGALLSRLDLQKKIAFRASFGTLAQYWKPAINQIMGQVADAIEEIKRDLELDGRSDLGSTYAPGDIYRFFSDLKAVINSATHEVLVVDPYFNGEAFDAYLSTASDGLLTRILADRYSKDISGYVAKHVAQFKTKIELRTSKELHDRLIFVDKDLAWIMGGSIKDAGKKAAYLIPLASQIASAKRDIYSGIWDRAENPLVENAGQSGSRGCLAPSPWARIQSARTDIKPWLFSQAFVIPVCVAKVLDRCQ